MTPEHFELNVDDHQLAAVCLNPEAKGEPVILLHGITGSISFWQTNPAKYLLEIGPCYSLSLPGHYPAVAPAAFRREILTSEKLVHLLAGAIRQLIGERAATLIGHSTGGFAALALAASQPELARRVVSIAGFARGYWTGILRMSQRCVHWGWPGEAYFKASYRLLALSPALFNWVMRFYAADSRAMYAHPDTAEAIGRMLPDVRRLDLDAMLPYFKYMPQIDITAQLPRIQAQTLVITGDRDPIVPPAQAYQIAKSVKGAELAVIQGAGHLPFTERADEYHRRVSQWLAQTNLANQ